jgi:hypothetical protein
MKVALLKEVRHRLLMLPYYGVFDDLAYRVDGDSVVLLGEVTQPVLKTDAERSVKGVEGVGQEIDVLPLSPMDKQIRLANSAPFMETRRCRRVMDTVRPRLFTSSSRTDV